MNEDVFTEEDQRNCPRIRYWNGKNYDENKVWWKRYMRRAESFQICELRREEKNSDSFLDVFLRKWSASELHELFWVIIKINNVKILAKKIKAIVSLCKILIWNNLCDIWKVLCSHQV